MTPPNLAESLKPLEKPEMRNATMDREHFDNLVHMLGAGPHIPRGTRGYRNYFCATVGGSDHKAMVEMESLGLVVARHTINEGKSQYFSATLEGCKAAGLSKAAIKRAMEV